MGWNETGHESICIAHILDNVGNTTVFTPVGPGSDEKPG